LRDYLYLRDADTFIDPALDGTTRLTLRKDPVTGFPMPGMIENWTSVIKNRRLHWLSCFDGKFFVLNNDFYDPETNLRLPAQMSPPDHSTADIHWYHDGFHHNDSKDPWTGVRLPAVGHKSCGQWTWAFYTMDVGIL
jgi:hypothetical protein